MLHLEALACGYPGARGVVVEAATLSLQAGAFVCVVGRNGAGKSTMTRTISGLQPPISGVARLDAQPITDMSPGERARAIAVVTTDRVSSPGLRARDVVELGRTPYTNWRGTLSADDRRIVADAMKRTGAAPFAASFIDSLSDGERQRVMIARALAQSSSVLVLDEITAFLDLPGRVEVMALLRRHAAATDKIVLLSNLELSLELAGELWIVNDGELSYGRPDVLIRSGAVARVFDSEDVTFDSNKGRFVLRRSQAHPSGEKATNPQR